MDFLKYKSKYICTNYKKDAYMKKLEKIQLKNLFLSSYVSDSNQISNYINDVINDLTIDKNNYTAFEVFPTDKVIPAGTKDTKADLSNLFPEISSSNCLFTNIEYSEDVPDGMTQCFEFYVNSEITKDKCDIVIDWGDGSEPLSVKTADVI